MILDTGYRALSSRARDRALDAALRLGERLLSVASLPHSNDDLQWIVSRSLGGTSGFALAFLALWRATGDARFEAAAHEFIRKAASLEDRPGIGLYGGMGGLRAVLAIALAYEPRYARLLEQCDAYIDERMPRDLQKPTSFSDYDLIVGWAGARLARAIEGPTKPDELIEAIAWVLADDERWNCVHPVRGGPPERDLGMAHGVTGLLAAMVLTLDDVGPYRQLVSSVAHDLARRAVDRSGVVLWPHTRTHDDPRMRAAWCYGTPGVAAALHATAEALGDRALSDMAVCAMESLLLVPSIEYIIDEPNICHGTIGNALCAASIAAHAPSTRLDRLIERYVNETVDQLVESRWHCLARNEHGVRDDLFDELTGSAGIITGLLTLCGAFDSRWMKVHGLRPFA